ncbi:hypothetical protein [Streptomyces lydicus]|uniref:hypothetical protein n=1 Tax=Streptomyces lydicus TaxID=47763 RepID=UPI0037CD09E1
MHQVIRLFESLLDRLLPATGRHRPDCTPPVVGWADVPRAGRHRVPARHTELLPGEDSALVRPYLLAFERREGERLRRTQGVEVAVA